MLKQDVDLDKPGLAQFYCVHCAKHFINSRAFSDHVKGKPHKRRLHALKTEPFTIEESERAAGMGSYTGPNRKRKMETLVPEAVKDGLPVGVNEPRQEKRVKAASQDEDGDQDMK